MYNGKPLSFASRSFWTIQIARLCSIMSILMFVGTPPIATAKPANNVLAGESSASHDSKTIDNRTWIDANRLLMFVNNRGAVAYDQDGVLGRQPGLYFPFHSLDDIFNGTHNKTLIWAGGLWIAGIDDATGDTIATVSEYSNEYWPGPLGAANAHLDPSFRVYKLYRDSLASNPNQDYLDWPVEQGAPVDNLGRPEFHGNQTLWTVFNDGVPEVHNNNNTGPFGLDVEIQITVWAFNEPANDEASAIYLRYKLINSGERHLNDMVVGLWFDPDMGDAIDDLACCDPSDDLFFCYNHGADAVYGPSPPAFAGKLLEGPAVPSEADTALINGVSVSGLRNLGMHSHASYRNGWDPTSAIETYNYMNGLNPSGSPMIDPTTGLSTRFFGSGDPVTGSGWVDTTPGDKRLLPSTGPFNFNPGDTQFVIWRLAIGQGDNNLNSITKAREILNKPADSDGDGIVYYLDNCPGQYNPDQFDADGDGLGNVCDDDISANCGDVNGNGIVSFGDLDFLINFYFMFGDPPVSLEAADVNLDGIIDLSDIISLANYLNGIGPAPCAGSEPPPEIDPKKKPEGHQTNDL